MTRLRSPFMTILFRIGSVLLFLAGYMAFVLIAGSFINPIGDGILSRNDQWISTAQTDNGMQEAENLFQAAVNSGMIVFNTAHRRLTTITKRELAARPGLAVQTPGVPGYPDAERVLQRLWKSRGAGHFVRQQIDAFNESLHYAAIRDSTGSLKACVDLPKVEQEACRGGLWVPHIDLLGGRLAIANSVLGRAPDVRSFGELAFDQIKDFRDWVSVTGKGIANRTIRFVAPRPPTISRRNSVFIDVIGRHVRMKNEDSEAQPSPADTTRYCFSSPDDKNRLKLAVCEPGSENLSVATRYRFKSNPIVDEIGVEVKPVETGRDIDRERESAYRIFESKIEKADKTAFFGSGGPKTYTLTQNIRLWCGKADYTSPQSSLFQLPQILPHDEGIRHWPGRVCALTWSGGTLLKALKSRSVSTSTIQISNSSSEASVGTREHTSVGPDALFEIPPADPGGLRLSQQGRGFGLVSVFGQSNRQPGSYLEFHSSLPPDKARNSYTTFDLNIQGLVFDHAKKLLTETRGIKGYENTISQKYDQARRAGLVILDIGTEGQIGAVRAAVGFPLYDGGLSDWDLLALRTKRPFDDPLAAHAWRHIDKRYTPGSVFKLVSALSLTDIAVKQVDGIPDPVAELAKNALAGLRSNEFQDAFGINYNNTSYSAPLLFFDRADDIPNFGSPFRDTSTNAEPNAVKTLKRVTEALGASGKPISISTGAGRISSASRSCGRNRAARNAGRLTYGVCEALMRSSNLWFSSVMTGINELALKQLKNSRQGQEKPELSPQFSNVSFLDRIDLLQGKQLISLVQIRNVNTPGNSSLTADGITLGLASLKGNSDGGAWNRAPGELTLSAYGQGSVQTSPLLMASIAGTIATGGRVGPYIVADEPYLPRPAGLYVDDQSETYLDMIRSGMHGAVNVRGGTAYGSFLSVKGGKAIADAVFGKTGTPLVPYQIGNSKRIEQIESSWFVGYTAPKVGVIPRRKPKYAFACVISHVSFGGSKICATLIAEILVAIENEAGGI